MKRILIVAVVLVAILLGVAVLWRTTDPAKRWIALNGDVAESYARVLLTGGSAKTPDELLDVTISVYPGWVLFSPHDDVHSLVLAYALNGRPEELRMNGSAHHWSRMGKSWYALSD